MFTKGSLWHIYINLHGENETRFIWADLNLEFSVYSTWK